MAVRVRWHECPFQCSLSLSRLSPPVKYTPAFFVAVFSSLAFITRDKYSKPTQNPFFYLWIIATLASAIYSYSWDILMDWSLMHVFEGDNKFLRDEIVYRPKVRIRSERMREKDL